MLGGIPFADWTPPTLLALAVLMVLFGRLFPRFVYLEKVKEAEKWEAAYKAEAEARRISDAQTAQLLEQAKMTHQMVESIFISSQRVRQSGGTDVVPAA